MLKTILFWYFIVLNVIAFLLMGVDKSKAKRGKWRIKERTLFLSAALGGSIGSILGMQLFRHKTKHNSFVFGMPAIFFAQIILVILIYCTF